MTKLDESSYFNRELSWLEFNQRVLDEACNPEVPLLERVKFLAITSSNLDEFYMVRVGGLQMLQNSQSTHVDPSGLTVTQQLNAIHDRTRQMVNDQYACLAQVEQQLRSEGIRRLAATDLTESQVATLEHNYLEEIVSV